MLQEYAVRIIYQTQRARLDMFARIWIGTDGSQSWIILWQNQIKLRERLQAR